MGSAPIVVFGHISRIHPAEVALDIAGSDAGRCSSGKRLYEALDPMPDALAMPVAHARTRLDELEGGVADRNAGLGGSPFFLHRSPCNLHKAQSGACKDLFGGCRIDAGDCVR